MKFKLFLLTLLLALTHTQFLFAQNPLDEKIRQIVAQSSLDENRTGVAAFSIEKGKILSAINADVPLNPASCAKIVTAAAALQILGPNYRFDTTFFTDRPPSNGTVRKLYVTGSGDPSLLVEDYWKMARDLYERGIRVVTEEIVIDDTYFDGEWFPRKDVGENRTYTAPTSSLAVNFNTATILVAPAARPKGQPIVLVEPKTDYIQIINKTRTGRRFAINIAASGNDGKHEIFTVSGTVPSRMSTQTLYRKISNPLTYAGYVLKEMLVQNGIQVAGSINKGYVPRSAYEILIEKGKPLNEIVADMMKFSNNFVSEQMVKHLGAVKKGRPGTTLKGIEVLSDYLSSIGIRPDTYTLENGSGLSSVSRISTSQIAKVLTSVYKNFEIQADFLSSMSTLGVDGTMRRWRSPNLTGVLRAKTGSLDGVSTLAGFAPMKNGDVAAFAIFSNGFKKGRLSPHDAQLKIVSAIGEAAP